MLFIDMYICFFNVDMAGPGKLGGIGKKRKAPKTPKKTMRLGNIKDGTTQPSPRRSIRLSPVNATLDVSPETSQQPSSRQSVRLLPNSVTPSVQAATAEQPSPRRSARLSPLKAMPSKHGGDKEALTKSIENLAKSSVNLVPQRKKARTGFQLRDEQASEDSYASQPTNVCQRSEVRRSIDLMAETHTQNTSITPTMDQLEHDEEVSGGDTQQQEQGK